MRVFGTIRQRLHAPRVRRAHGSKSNGIGAVPKFINADQLSGRWPNKRNCMILFNARVTFERGNNLTERKFCLPPWYQSPLTTQSVKGLCRQLCVPVKSAGQVYIATTANVKATAAAPLPWKARLELVYHRGRAKSLFATEGERSLVICLVWSDM